MTYWHKWWNQLSGVQKQLIMVVSTVDDQWSSLTEGQRTVTGMPLLAIVCVCVCVCMLLESLYDRASCLRSRKCLKRYGNLFVKHEWIRIMDLSTVYSRFGISCRLMQIRVFAMWLVCIAFVQPLFLLSVKRGDQPLNHHLGILLIQWYC